MTFNTAFNLKTFDLAARDGVIAREKCFSLEDDLFGTFSHGVLIDAFWNADRGIDKSPIAAVDLREMCLFHDLCGDTLWIDDWFSSDVLNEMRAEAILANISAEAEEGRAEVAELFASIPKNDAAEISEIADKFASALRGYLSESQFEDMRHKNAGEGFTSICASGDYCDSNVFMAEAFEAVTGREIDPSSDSDARIWNEAWRLAKREYLTA